MDLPEEFDVIVLGTGTYHKICINPTSFDELINALSN